MADDKKEKSTSTTQPKKGSPRPFPTFPRAKGANPRIFALLIGINDYQGEINKLGGCITDINLAANYLRKNYGADKSPKSIGPHDSINEEEINGKLHLHILTNAEATYENMIEVFSTHMINGGGNGDDSFWFHFSGHGTEQFTAEEFHTSVDSETGEKKAALVPNGKDQCLVGYNPGGTQEGIFLADKELAAMLKDLYHAAPYKEETPRHIVVTLDCCHSGTGTRDFLEPEGFKTRHHDFLKTTTRDGIEHDGIRSIKDYYDGYYDRMQQAGELFIPQTRHLLIAACTNREKAGDSISGGIFTSSFIETLEKGNKEDGVKYLDLFRQTRALSRFKRSAQTTQFEAVAGFNPHTAFLSGWGMGDSKKDYEVIPKGNNWYVGCGAIHGLTTKNNGKVLPEGSSEEIILKVFKKEGRSFMGHVLVKDVGVQDSRVEVLEPDNWVGELTRSEPNAEGNVMAAEPYVAEIYQMPADPFYVALETEDNIKQLFIENWASSDDDEHPDLSKLNIFIADQEEEKKQANTRITIDQTKTRLWNIHQDTLWLDAPIPAQAIDLAKINIIKSYIAKIVRWHRLLALENETSNLKNAFELSLHTMDLPQWKKKRAEASFEMSNDTDFIKNATKQESTTVRLVIPEADFIAQKNMTSDEINTLHMQEDEDDNLYYSLRLQTKQKGLYFYLFNFTNQAAIEIFPAVDPDQDEDNPAPPTIQNPLPDQTEVIIPQILFLTTHQNTDTTRVKLLVTRKPIDAELLLQSPFDGEKGSKRRNRGHSVSDSWYCQTVELTLVREKGEIKQDEELVLENGNVVIQSHSSLQAGITVSNNSSGIDRGMHANPLQHLAATGVHLHTFSDERSLSAGNVLDLSLKGDVPTDLATNPLKINLNEALSDNEVLVPVIFDGEFLRVAGDAEQVDGKTQVSVREIPEKRIVLDNNGQQIPNPLGVEDNNRSPIKALKLAFFKWSTRRQLEDADDNAVLNEVNKLSRVKYAPDGSITRNATKLKVKVKRAKKKGKKIILAVHGLIGDSAGIAQNLLPILGKTSEEIQKEYLILAYDYENLNTEIQTTAGHLLKRLQAIGISADHPITIIAHSMGGLVSRCLVEQLDGAPLVKHLIMAGTPNAGSPFGKVPGWLGHARSLLEFGLNFIPKQVPVLGNLLKGLETASKANLLKTLKQMKPGSIPFLSELNTPDVKPENTAYSILAGDVSNYKQTDTGFAAFMDNTKVSIGNLVNKEAEHDIAVTVDSILNADVWETREQAVVLKTVDCHHMNYFTTEIGRNALKEILS